MDFLKEIVKEARDLVSAGRRNLIINGNFEIWQRDDDYENTTTDWNYYSVDRFKHNKGRYRQVTTTVDGREVKALEVSPSSGVYNGGRAFFQLIEDYKVYNKVTTISAYIKSDVPSTINFGRIYNYTTSAEVPNSGKTIQTTTTFQKFELTNPSFDPNQSPGQYIINDLQDGVTYTIANVQVEVGKNATDFEYRSYGEELALCQRYYIRYNADDPYTRWGLGIAQNTTTLNAIIHHPVTMRDVPSSIEDSGIGTIQASNTYLGYSSTASATLTGNTDNRNAALVSVAVNSGLTQGSTYFLEAANNSNAFIAFNAEL